MIINLLKLLRAKLVQLICFVLIQQKKNKCFVLSEKVGLHVLYFFKKWHCATVTLRGNEKM